MEEIEHTTVATNRINMHIASIGRGPAILFAPGLRGYGDTDGRTSVREDTGFHVAGDLIGLLNSLGIDLVFLVGHDWGAMIASYFCTMRRDSVKASVTTSVPFLHDYYLCRFQLPLLIFYY
ncbi:hypothetical protein NC652_033345 [Populus alba x Populus x berolinensis]|nr:hypothetical protein NC652_033345 [Populus alba x Populus x berolinensis]